MELDFEVIILSPSISGNTVKFLVLYLIRSVPDGPTSNKCCPITKTTQSSPHHTDLDGRSVMLESFMGPYFDLSLSNANGIYENTVY